jgi:DNA-binding transcriptional LysR family regulator
MQREGDHRDDELDEPTIVQLRALTRLSEGSYGAVASDRSDRSALWQAISRFERSINAERRVGLPRIRLVREGGQALTEQGEILAIAAKTVVQAADSFHGSLLDVLHEPNELMLACYPAQAPLVGFLQTRKGDEFPAIQLVDIDDGFRDDAGEDLLDRLRKGQIDITIAPSSADLKTLKSTYLYSWNLAVISRPGVIPGDDEDVDIAKLGEYPLLVSPRGHATRELLESAESTLNVKFESTSVDALVGLAATGFGVAVVAGDSLPVQSARSAVRERWKLVSHEESVLGGHFIAAHRRSSAATPAVTEVVNELARSAKQRVEARNSKFIHISPEVLVHE